MPNNKEKCTGNCPNTCKIHMGEFAYCTNEGCLCHRPAHSTEESVVERIRNQMIDNLALSSPLPPLQVELEETYKEEDLVKRKANGITVFEEPQREWEKEFDEIQKSMKYTEYGVKRFCCGGDYCDGDHVGFIKSFISKWLSQTKREAYEKAMSDGKVVPKENVLYQGAQEAYKRGRREERERILKIVEGMKRAVPKDPMDITPREAMSAVVLPIHRPYKSGEESYNDALSDLSSRIQEEHE